MAAATLTVSSFGRASVTGTPAFIPVTVTASATVYATASGGLPIDLTTVLQQAAPFAQGFIHPSDVVGLVPTDLSTNGYLPGGLTIGAPTYTSQAGTDFNNKVLATCPATIRLRGIGASAANHAALGEVADGAVTDTISFMLIVARGGANL